MKEVSYNEALALLNRKSVKLAVKLSNSIVRIKSTVLNKGLPQSKSPPKTPPYQPFADPVRVWTNDELKKLAPLFTGDIVNISGWEDKDKEGDYYKNYFKKARSYTVTNFSQHMPAGSNEIELDLEKNLRKELKGKFNVVFSHTILEHIYEVKKAFRNMSLMTKDIVITIVPFMQQQHEEKEYKDYWRFTPSALRRLAQDNGMEVIYENYRRDPYEITYIISVASKKPRKWIKKMPAFEELRQIADWLG